MNDRDVRQVARSPVVVPSPPRVGRRVEVGVVKPFDHVWFWRWKPWRPIDRKGQPCRVLARGKLN